MKKIAIILVAILFVTFTQSCKKAVVPTVVTNQPTDIQYQTATLSGEVTTDGDADVTDRGFIYSNQSDLTEGNVGVTTVQAGSGTGAFTANVTGLSPSTTYYVKTFATNEVGKAYGSVITFSTL